MTPSVFHRDYAIDLNLTESDLGHPDRSGLLDELYRSYRPDLQYCLDAYEHGGFTCPGFMTICESSGGPHEMRVPKGEIKETTAESDSTPALTSGTAAFQANAPGWSCTNLLQAFSSTFTITWNTGQTSTISGNATSTLTGAVLVYTLTGTVTAGLFAGDTVLQTDSLRQPSWVHCSSYSSVI